MNETLDQDHLWRQFIQLGDMMGDGLHHESDGRWISKEYSKLAKILIPDIKQHEKEVRKQKNLLLDDKIKTLLQEKKCSCGGILKQSRSGSMVAYCTSCNTRYKARKRN